MFMIDFNICGYGSDCQNVWELIHNRHCDMPFDNLDIATRKGELIRTLAERYDAVVDFQVVRMDQ